MTVGFITVTRSMIPDTKCLRNHVPLPAVNRVFASFTFHDAVFQRGAAAHCGTMITSISIRLLGSYPHFSTFSFI